MFSIAEHVAGRGRKRLAGEHRARRHALERCIHGREQDRGLVAAFDMREPRQGGHALRQHRGMRRHAVIGQAIPGREFHDRQIGREEGQSARQGRHARPVAADDHEADRRRVRFAGDRARKIRQHQAFGAVRDIRERQLLPGFETDRRASGPSARVSRRVWRIASMRRKKALSYCAGTACPRR